MNHESLVEKYLGITNYHTEKIPLPPPSLTVFVLITISHYYDQLHLDVVSFNHLYLQYNKAGT